MSDLENHVALTAEPKREVRSSTAFEQDVRCPTCNLGWWLNPPVKCDGNNDAWRCIGCKAIYTTPMLAATEMLSALQMVEQERGWLRADLENQTCSDLCDKTYEQQGCPSGTCARETGLATFSIVTHAIRDAIAKAVGDRPAAPAHRTGD